MRHTLILGGNVTGQAAARLAARLGDRVSVYDARSLDPAAFKPDVTFEFGEWRDGLLDDVDLVVTSPGFPPHSAPISATVERGVRLWGDIELATRHLDTPIAAITGTNGKTTVTEMTSAILTAQGLEAPAVGNIGAPPVDYVDRDVDILVMEVSSFQLYYTESFHPQVAVVLNVAPDHLDWHSSFDAYMDAKAKIFHEQGPGDHLVFAVDDPGARQLASRAGSRLVGVSGTSLPPGGAGPDGGVLVVPTGRVALDELASNDPIFRVDFAAAAVAASLLGAEHEAVLQVARTYTLGDHRRKLVGTWDGVAWVNDSKASNPHAAIAAIGAFRSVVLIAGGRNKGLDLSGLVGVQTVRHVIAIGESAEDLVEAAAGDPVAQAASSMAEAVAIADGVARQGDTVLLSPGCASFDMFSSYVERGEVFTSEVRSIKEDR